MADGFYVFVQIILFTVLFYKYLIILSFTQVVLRF
jgi:hypothetical protein